MSAQAEEPSDVGDSRRAEPADERQAVAGMPGGRAARDGWSMRVLKKAMIVAAPWVALIIVWYLLRLSGLVKPGLVPTPWQVANAFWSMLTEQSLWLDMYMSAQSVLMGGALGTTCAVPIGFGLGWYASIREFLDPLINFFRAIPPIALIPLVIIYFGIGE